MTVGRAAASGQAVTYDAFERAAWQERERGYAEIFAQLTRLAAQALVSAVRVAPGQVVLEVGCGSGSVSSTLVATGATLVLSDASRAMVGLARGAAPGAGAVCAALPALPFADDSVDAVVGGFVVNHLGDPGSALAELHRVTRAGGRIALTCWDRSPGRTAPTAVFDHALRVAGVNLPPAPAGPPALTLPGFRGLFDDALWQDAEVERLTLVHAIDPGLWWTGLITGTARIGAAFAALDERQRLAVRQAYDELVRDRVDGHGRFRLEAVALLGHASARPGPASS